MHSVPHIYRDEDLWIYQNQWRTQWWVFKNIFTRSGYNVIFLKRFRSLYVTNFSQSSIWLSNIDCPICINIALFPLRKYIISLYTDVRYCRKCRLYFMNLLNLFLFSVPIHLSFCLHKNCTFCILCTVYMNKNFNKTFYIYRDKEKNIS